MGDCRTHEHEADQSPCLDEGEQQVGLHDPGVDLLADQTRTSQDQPADALPLPPMPAYMNREASWRKVVEASQGNKGDFANTIFREVPVLREVLKELGGSVRLSVDRPVTVGAAAHFELDPTSQAWFRSNYETFRTDRAKEKGCTLQGADAPDPISSEAEKTAQDPCSNHAIFNAWLSGLQDETIKIPPEVMRGLIVLKPESLTLKNLDDVVQDSLHELTHAQQHLAGLNQKRFLTGFLNLLGSFPINDAAVAACQAEAQRTNPDPKGNLRELDVIRCGRFNQPSAYLEPEDNERANNEVGLQEIDAYAMEAFIASLYSLSSSAGPEFVERASHMYIAGWSKLSPDGQKSAQAITSMRAQMRHLFPNIAASWQCKEMSDVIQAARQKGDLLAAYDIFSARGAALSVASMPLGVDLSKTRAGADMLVNDTGFKDDARFQALVAHIQESKGKIDKIENEFKNFLSTNRLYEYQDDNGQPAFERLGVIQALGSELFDQAWLNDQEAQYPILLGHEFNALSVLHRYINHNGRTPMDETVRDPAAHYENPDPFIGVYVLFGEGPSAEVPRDISLIEPFMKSVNQHLAGGVQVDYIEIRGFSDTTPLGK
jgi:hypothetical protein